MDFRCFVALFASAWKAGVQPACARERALQGGSELPLRSRDTSDSGSNRPENGVRQVEEEEEEMRVERGMG